MPLKETIDVIQHSSQTGSDIFTLIFSILIAGAGAALWMRRKLSKDSLEIKKDSAESDLIQHLEDERDVLKKDKEHLFNRLIQTDTEKNEAVNKVGQLSVEVKHLSAQVNQLELMVNTLSHELKSATTAMQELVIENANLNAKLGAMKEIFSMKCDNCTYKRECDLTGSI